MSVVSKPILCRFEGDCHIRLFDVAEGDDMDTVASICAQHIVGRQVAAREGMVLRVRRTTEDDSAAPFPREMTVKDAGIIPFEQLDIFYEEPARG